MYLSTGLDAFPWSQYGFEMKLKPCVFLFHISIFSIVAQDFWTSRIPETQVHCLYSDSRPLVCQRPSMRCAISWGLEKMSLSYTRTHGRTALTHRHTAPTHWKPARRSWITPVWKINGNFSQKPCKSSILWGRVCDCMVLCSEHGKNRLCNSKLTGIFQQQFFQCRFMQLTLRAREFGDFPHSKWMEVRQDGAVMAQLTSVNICAMLQPPWPLRTTYQF